MAKRKDKNPSKELVELKIQIENLELQIPGLQKKFDTASDATKKKRKLNLENALDQIKIKEKRIKELEKLLLVGKSLKSTNVLFFLLKLINSIYYFGNITFL